MDDNKDNFDVRVEMSMRQQIRGNARYGAVTNGGTKC